MLRKNWRKAGRNALIATALLVVADQSGLLLHAADAALQRSGSYAYHIAPDVQVRVSSRICRFFSSVPTGVEMRAITIGRTVFLPREGLTRLAGDAAAHELAHVRQWEQYGLLGFGISYGFWQVLRGYDGNPFERSAQLSVF